jgi:hypothetical protein
MHPYRQNQGETRHIGQGLARNRALWLPAGPGRVPGMTALLQWSYSPRRGLIRHKNRRFDDYQPTVAQQHEES